jgi:hypothetical protein
MSYRFQTAFCIFGILCGSIGLAQNYKCDWSVNGIGGGDMAGSNYKCGSTVGQTAAGQLTGTSYWALIGFWQPEGQVGVREQAYSPNQPFVTRLYAPKPNPSRAAAFLRYSLGASAHASLSIHDLTGRQIRVLVNSQQKPGTYSVTWNGRDQVGRSLANGVYFCRFTAGDYRATEKLVLER